MKKISIFRYWLGTKIFRGKRQAHYLRKYKQAHLIVPDSFEKETFSQPMEKTLLIVNTDSIGDYILFRNLLGAIRKSKKYNEYEITFIGCEKYQSFAQYLDSDIINHFLWLKARPQNYDNATYFSQYQSLRAQGLKNHYDSIIFLSLNSMVHLSMLSKLLKDVTFREKMIAAPALFEHKDPHDLLSFTYIYTDFQLSDQPEYYFVFNFLKRFVEHITKEPIDLPYPMIEEHKVLFSSRLNNIKKEYIVINPCASEVLRMWHPQNWVTLIKWLKQNYDLDIIFVCGPNEKNYCQSLAQAVGGKIPVFENLSSKELLGILKLAKLYIGMDSGVFHIAAALNIRALCLSSGISYYRFLTYDKNRKNIRIVFPQGVEEWIHKHRQAKLSFDRPYFWINRLDIAEIQKAINELLELQDIIFIHKLRTPNTGDLEICPLDLFKNYFYQQGVIQRFDLDDMQFLLFKKAIYVLGGGGIINQNNDWNNWINALTSAGNKVIGWGIGFNQHYGVSLSSKINFHKFTLIGIRDYGKNLPYLPCVSCLKKVLNIKLTIKRRIGCMAHYSNPFSLGEYDLIYNNVPVVDLIRFIAESEIIVTNTYHMVYWATLMGKKVILFSSFSNKFDSFKYPPVRYSGDLEKDIAQAHTYPQALEECRELNLAFFKKVKKIVETNCGKKQK